MAVSPATLYVPCKGKLLMQKIEATSEYQSVQKAALPMIPGRFLSIIIPAFNESKRILATFKEIRPWLDQYINKRYEVIVVDDGSFDLTDQVLKQEGEKWSELLIIRQPKNWGKGAALRRGCLAAKGDYVLFMDADHATPIQELPGFFEQIERGYNIVAGLRTQQECESVFRRIVGLSLLVLAHILVFNKSVVDSQCGFKLLDRETCRTIFSRCRVSGGMIDIELISIAHLMDMKIYFAPVKWEDKPGSTISVWKCMLVDPFALLGIMFRHLRGKYAHPIPRQPWDK